nr:MAG TPA: hypothetical protein [Caudoviricetes sp.]
MQKTLLKKMGKKMKKLPEFLSKRGEHILYIPIK